MCRTCDMISGKVPAKKLFEDEKCLAYLHDTPAALGHIVVVPKNHYPIIEQVPDIIMSHLFIVANRLSNASFEALNAKGSNILVNNGLAAGQKSAHVCLHVLPRRDEDKLNFEWKPKQLSQEQISGVELKVRETKEQMEKGAGPRRAETGKEPASVPASAGPSQMSFDDEEDNYLLKSIDRVP